MKLLLAASVAIAVAVSWASGFVSSMLVPDARCSRIPYPFIKSNGVVYFVSTGTSDTVFTGPGAVEVSAAPGHWGPGGDRAIYGQRLTVERFAGVNARFVARALAAAESTVVAVPWDYDPACQPVPWSGSAASTTVAGFVVAQPRPVTAWVGGVPVVDVFYVDHQPYFHGRIFREGYRGPSEYEGLGAPLAPAEMFALFDALPTWAAFQRDSAQALSPLQEWVRSHPLLHGRYPVRGILRHFDLSW